MFKFLLLAGVLAPATAIASTLDDSGSGAIATAEASIAVVVHQGNLDLRSRVQRAEVLRHDCGDFLIVELEPRLRLALRDQEAELVALPDLAEEEELFLVGLRANQGTEYLTSQGARVLFRHGDQALVAAPTGGTSRFQNLLPGHSFHGGASRVRTRTMAAPRPFSAPGGTLAMGVTNANIQAAVDAVDENNLEQHVIDLSAIYTRCASGSGAVTARNQIVSKLQSYGYTPTLQNFSGSYSENVVAELPGTAVPERIVVIGAHYDSIGSSCSGAGPGADDNATGTAGVLEAARVLANAGPFENTVRFILFSAEEAGLVGSNYSSGQSASNGEDIIAMLNTDMSAYRANGDTRDVAFVTNNSTGSLITFCDTVGGLYVSNWASKTGSLSGGTSDHQSYFTDGFPAIFFFEDTGSYSPYIHSSQDTHALSTTDFLLSKMIVQGIVAATGTLADPVDLTITHTALGDSQNLGPYDVVCQVDSQVGSNVTRADLHYSVQGGGWVDVSMAQQGNDWVAQIPGSGSPVTIEYYLTAEDDQGGSEDLPGGVLLGAAPFSFFVGQLTVHVFYDFEAGNDQGWTHGQVATQDDWQRGSPNGSSGDASSAYSGTRVWGNDLGGSGWNGEYQANVNNWLRSPVMDLSATTQVLLQYRRWLTVEEGVYDQAQIRINGVVVWQNPNSGNTMDSSWTKHTIDISSHAAGNGSVQVEYRLLSDGGLQFGGWNIDDFSIVTEDPVGCGSTSNYCTLSPNSAGAGAVIGSNGEVGIANNAFVLDINGAPANKPGLFFYGQNQVSIPFGEGVRCVGGSLYRLGVLTTDVFGLATRSLDFTNMPTGGDITAGSSWNFQFWYRDPSGGPVGYNVSDALAATFCP